MLHLRIEWNFILAFIYAVHAAGISTEHFPTKQGDFRTNLASLPNLDNVPAGTFEQLGTDKFFSLWKIFIDSRNSTNLPWTLLSPLNEGLPQGSSFIAEEEFTRKVLLNHVIIGDSIDIEDPKSEKKIFYSYSNSVLVFTRGQGHNFVNGIRMTGEKIMFGNGIIYPIEKYIPLTKPQFAQFVPFSDRLPLHSTAQKIPKHRKVLAESLLPLMENMGAKGLPNTGELSELNNDSPTIVRNSHSEPTANLPTIPRKEDIVQVTKKITSSVSSQRSSKESTIFDTILTSDVELEKPLIESETSQKLQLERESINNTFGLNSDRSAPSEEFSEFAVVTDSSESSFSDSMLKALDGINSNGREFSHHFKASSLDKFLLEDKKYTAIIPTDTAFYNYYPIDWGFNPFKVENFTKDVLMNHILEGDVDLFSFDDYVQIQTVEGRIINVSQDREGTVLINGNTVSKETELLVPRGRLYFVHKLLFVDYDRVSSLRKEYPFLETAPLLSFPWPYAPFLSHLLTRVQKTTDTKFFAHLLKNSHISTQVPSSDEHYNHLAYSAFIPKDDFFGKNISVEMLADSIGSEDAQSFLLDHIVPEYLLEKDFKDGFYLRTLSNKTIQIRVSGGEIFVGQSKIQQPQKFVYNLGTIFYIDKPLFEFPFEKRSKAIEIQGGNPFSELVSDTSQHKQVSIPIKSEAFALSTLGNTGEAVVPTPTKIPFEVRTEVSYSRQINGGPNISITKEQMEKELRL